MNRSCAGTTAGRTEHEYMCSVGAPAGGPGRGPKSEDQSNPKTSSEAGAAAGRFRLIVDDWAAFNPGLARFPGASKMTLKPELECAARDQTSEIFSQWLTP